MTVSVSIVVPTFQRPVALSRCLAALLAQDYDPSAYEIIVVDDAASPITRRQVEEMDSLEIAIPLQMPIHLPVTVGPNIYEARMYSSGQPLQSLPVRPHIHYLPVGKTRGPAAARNLGWKSASGEIVAFTDDDTIPEPDWLKLGVNAFCQEVAGVAGRVIVPLPDEPRDHDWDMLGLSRSLFITANCFYRRSVLEVSGGFDERFTTAWREDSDLFFTLLENGHVLVEAPQAVVIHPVRQSPWGVSLQAQKKSIFNALLYKKHPALYRKYIQAAPPWKYYAILAALLGLLLSMVGDRRELALVFMAIWTGMTLQFTYQRLEHTSHRLDHILEMLVTSTFIPPLSVFWRLVGAVKYKVWFI